MKGERNMLAVCLAMLDEPGEKVLFEHIYNKYRGKMLAVAYNITGNYHDAEEAVSNAFLKIAKCFAKLKERKPQERAAFCCVITKNCAYDIMRDRDRRNEISLDENEELPDGKADVSDEVLSGHGYNRVVEAIKALPEIYAQALWMQNVVGLSVPEIARSLGETEQNIRKRLERARTKLRVILEEQGIEVN